MAGISKKILCNRSFLSIVILLSFIGCFSPLCYGEKKGNVNWGLSVLLGPNARGHLDFTHSAVLPRAGLALHKKWDLEFEANLSHYFINGEKDLYLIGVNGNLLFKPVQWGKVTPFLIAGAGLAYNNNSGFVWEMGDSHTGGILQGGGGIFYDMGKKLLLRGEYRFHHLSDPFERDHGLNTHSFVIGVAF
jgi:opacity protein-like surface antigen